ncbi:MAG: hypothetical protein KTR28_07310 [Micavibrio sp.]|nr:hypothetical protein [Micavibrio sp.]
MSYSSNNLSVLAYANAFTLWHYTTTDDAITGTGYFNAAADMVNVGDLVIANVDTDGTPATVFYVVTSVSAGTVAITAYA